MSLGYLWTFWPSVSKAKMLFVLKNLNVIGAFRTLTFVAVESS